MAKATKAAPGLTTGDPSDEKRVTEHAQKFLQKYGPWVGLGDAARLARVSYFTLLSAVKTGRTPALHVGGRWLVREQTARQRVGLTAKAQQVQPQG